MLDYLSGVDARTGLAIHAIAAVVTVAAVLAVAALLRAPSPRDDRFGIYESGAPAAGLASGPVPASYFQVAAFFVIFDVEAAVLVTWAMAAPAAGVAGLVSAGVFIAVLLAALAYLWADGALDVGPRA